MDEMDDEFKEELGLLLRICQAVKHLPMQSSGDKFYVMAFN